MRPWTILIAVAILGTGCTHTALERRTVKQASTLTDLQYKQVLDNLAMFACNKDAMAWHVKLKGGTVQIADQGSSGFTADIASATGGEVTRLLPSAGAQRGVLNQWDVGPVVDAEELEFLSLAYQRAVYPGNPEVTYSIYKAICDLMISNRVVLEKQDTLTMIANLKQMATGDKLKAIESAEERIKGHYARIEILNNNLRHLEANRDEQKKLREDKEFWRIQILLALPTVCDSKFVPTYDPEKTERNVAVAEQAKAKIIKLLDLADDKFNSPWLCVGTKKDVPQGACLVGHHCGCYVWVLPGQQQKFRDFTLIVLTLVPPEVTQDIRGPAYSPAIGGR